MVLEIGSDDDLLVTSAKCQNRLAFYSFVFLSDRDGIEIMNYAFPKDPSTSGDASSGDEDAS